MTTLLDIIIDAAPITLVEAQAILAAIKEPVMKVADQWDGFAAGEIEALLDGEPFDSWLFSTGEVRPDGQK